MGLHIYKRGWWKTIDQYELQKILEKEGIADARKISLIICGDHDIGHHNFTLIDNSWSEGGKVTFLQRVNRLWFVPIYLLTIPFQWLFRGSVGFSNESKAGALVRKLTGLI